ncbi:MAG: DEAD/DEAH box helicase [Candidatus Binatia bacterium]
MIVLHAGAVDKQLFLWGEVPLAEQDRQKRQRNKQVSEETLPYNASTEALASALTTANIAVTTSNAAPANWCIWLPTVDKIPIASSPLIAEPPPSLAKATVAPWTVTTYPLSIQQFVDLLSTGSGKQVLAPGIVIGKDLAYWTMALRLAGALITQQRFLPNLDHTRERYRACWQPVLTGTVSEAFATLSKQMPHVCRALTHEQQSPPQSPASTVLSVVLAEMVDYLIRSSTDEHDSTPQPKTRTRKTQPSFGSIHDQWLYHLRSAEAEMNADTQELSQLATQIREWQRHIAVSAAAPFRLCFRLEEPNIEEESLLAGRTHLDAWYVRYLLQAADDPSLLIEAKDTWTMKGNKATLLQREGFNVREYLLSALGQTAGICPRIERSLKTASPGGYELDAAGAYEFLTEKAQALELAGFGVLLPAWWTRKGTKLCLTARAEVTSPKLQTKGGLSLDTIAQFRWQVALGDEVLSEAELKALAKLKQPLVRIRGQWVQMSAEEIQAALEFWKQKAANKTALRDIVRVALGAEQTPGGMAFTGVTAEGWIADFLGQLDGRTSFEELPPPEHFHGTLRPYQQRGYSWLGFLRRWGLGACLADDMGLGKTIQTLSLIQRDWETNGKRPVLLICPTSVVGNWQKEAARFTPDLPVLVHHGLTRMKSAAFAKEAHTHALVISSYALLHRDVSALEKVAWAGIILDEAQNIKNPETKQAKAARTLPAEYRIALTGTPVENNVGDLWSIMEFLNPGFLGTQSSFKRSFFVPIQANRDPEAVARLKRITGPFILRRLKTDKSIIADLPEKMEMKVFCTLTKEQASLYAAVVQETIPELEAAEGMQRRGMILGALSKLKQACNHPAQLLGDNSALPGRSGKLARLTEMLEEMIEVGDRALVFTQFAEMGTLLRRHLQEHFGQEVLFLHGGTSKPQRDRMVERFQAEDVGPQVFILSLKAGGTGLNLTRANHVFHFDRWWNPAVENQATDRAFRIGQTKNVLVHKFLCVGTLEEKIDEMIEQKKDIAEQVVGAGEGWLTELSTAELKELFALRQEAVRE